MHSVIEYLPLPTLPRQYWVYYKRPRRFIDIISLAIQTDQSQTDDGFRLLKPISERLRVRTEESKFE